jgi:hypothetical protein
MGFDGFAFCSAQVYLCMLFRLWCICRIFSAFCVWVFHHLFHLFLCLSVLQGEPVGFWLSADSCFSGLSVGALLLLLGADHHSPLQSLSPGH